MRRFLFCALTAFVLSAAQASPQIVVHKFLPLQADPTHSYAPNRPFTAGSDRAVASNRQLLVFLPGSGGLPAGYTRFLSNAAQLGHHVIGLDYVSSYANGVWAAHGGNFYMLCGDDASCYGPARQEMFDGLPHSSVLSMAPQDGIENRLVIALRYLAHTYPQEDWGAFLSPHLRRSRPDYQFRIGA